MNILEDMKQYLEQVWGNDSERLSYSEMPLIISAYVDVLNRIERATNRLGIPDINEFGDKRQPASYRP